MSRRHFGNQTSQYNIITGGDQPNVDSNEKRDTQASNTSIFPTQDEGNRFQTSSGQIGNGFKASQRVSPDEESTPYYGRKKKTNEFYSVNGVSFNDNDAPQHSARSQSAPSEESKYSKFY